MGDHSRRDWLLQALIGALLATAGFFGRDLYDDWKQRRARDEAQLQELRGLSVLLEESLSIYVAQNYQAQRLFEMLTTRIPDAVPAGYGYDDTFHHLHDRMTPRERQLQSIIRGTTMNSMRRVNEEMSAWLRRNPAFKSSSQPTPARKELADALRRLELHLNQWHDKYAATIPGDPRRTLVYLADEREHGIGFPSETGQLVRRVIDEWAAAR